MINTVVRLKKKEKEEDKTPFISDIRAGGQGDLPSTSTKQSEGFVSDKR